MTDRQHNPGNQVHLSVSGASSAHMNLADGVATAGGQADNSEPSQHHH